MTSLDRASPRASIMPCKRRQLGFCSVPLFAVGSRQTWQYPISDCWVKWWKLNDSVLSGLLISWFPGCCCHRCSCCFSWSYIAVWWHSSTLGIWWFHGISERRTSASEEKLKVEGALDKVCEAEQGVFPTTNHTSHWKAFQLLSLAPPKTLRSLKSQSCCSRGHQTGPLLGEHRSAPGSNKASHEPRSREAGRLLHRNAKHQTDCFPQGTPYCRRPFRSQDLWRFSPPPSVTYHTPSFERHLVHELHHRGDVHGFQEVLKHVPPVRLAKERPQRTTAFGRLALQSHL